MIPSLEDIAGQFARLLPESVPSDAPPRMDKAGLASGSAVASLPAEAGLALAGPAPAAAICTVDYARRGVHLEATVPADRVVAAAELLDRAGFALDAVTGVDWIAQDQMEVVYDFFHPEGSFRVAVRARIPRANPEIATLRAVFPGADWHERETHDFFGIRFAGHPNLEPLLLPEDATYHPLRKDYAP